MKSTELGRRKQRYKTEDNRLMYSTAEENQMVIVDYKLKSRQQCDALAKLASLRDLLVGRSCG